MTLGSALTRSRGGALLFTMLLVAALVVLATRSSSGGATFVVSASLAGLGALGLGIWFAGRYERTREQALVEQQLQTLRAASDLAGIGEWRWDLRTQRIDYGRGCARMLGYADGEIDSSLSAWGKLAHPDDLPRVRVAVDDLVEGRTDRYEHRLRLRAKDGSWRTIVDRGAVIARGRDGRPTIAIGVHTLVPVDIASVTAFARTCVVVDDDASVRVAIESAARRLGFAVASFPDADAAWRAIEANGEPLVIITDFSMPGMLGTELAARVYAAGLRCPVLLVSGSLPPDLSLGPAITATLAKPFTLADIGERLQALIAARA